MAKVYDYDGSNSYPLIVEDPRPSNDNIYINGYAHKKDTLTPRFGKRLNYSTTSTSWSTKHSSSRSYYSQPGQQIALPKATGGVGYYQDETEDYKNYLDMNSWAHMDPNYQPGTIFNISDGTQSAVMQLYNNSATAYMTGWDAIASTVDLDEAIVPTYESTSYTRRMFPLTTTVGENKYIVGISGTGGFDTNMYNYPNNRIFVTGSAWPLSYPTTYMHDATGFGNYWSVQVLGVSQVDGSVIFAGTYKGTGASGSYVKIVKGTWTTSTTPTWTELAYFSTNPVAGGTNAGGDPMGSKAYNHNFSQWFTDPRDPSGNTKCFYFTYYDSAYNFHPSLITWDTSTDIFSREDDITCDVLSSVHEDMSGWVSNSSNKDTTMFNLQTWTVGSNRYISVIKLDGRGIAKDSDIPFRTWLVYKVDASDPKQLTYHSKVTVPYTPRGMIWLNDSHTMMGVWFKDSFRVYVFSEATGWAETTTINEPVYTVGRDSTDRIWYTSKSNYSVSYCALSLLTPALPTTVSIVPASTDYTYAGTDINTSITLNVYNVSGARIAVDVKLVIEGSSMTFSDGTSVKTVTTSDTADTTVDLIIVSAGFSNINASISI